MDVRQAALDVRTVNDQTRTFTGYASVFGRQDSYNDIVAKGAFRRTLAEAAAAGRMPALLWQHDTTNPIGIYLEMREDDTGLFVKGKLADTTDGERAYRLLKLDALDGLSIGFRTRTSTFDTSTGIRTLTDVDLMECSIVTFPANDAARVLAVKSRTWASPAEELMAHVDRFRETALQIGRESRRQSEASAVTDIRNRLAIIHASQRRALDAVSRFVAEHCD